MIVLSAHGCCDSWVAYAFTSQGIAQGSLLTDSKAVAPSIAYV